MTNQVLFIQGGGEGTHDEWDNKILDSLKRELGPDYAIRYPRMPNEADPKYAEWKTTLKRQFAGLDDGAIVVGHGCDRGDRSTPRADAWQSFLCLRHRCGMHLAEPTAHHS